MPTDYLAIRHENIRRYGTDIGRIGPMLLADRYDDRTHFIFELLQNAEDALARRQESPESRTVTFHLAGGLLRVSHFGQPFDEADVRGICGIDESTKKVNSIGRFGIGFKSVYAFSDRPEVHSGAEDFAIESFVWPDAVPPVHRHQNETVILIPVRTSDVSGQDEIEAGLSRLDSSTLLFLRQIKEIEWTVDGGPPGSYRREFVELDAGVRRVSLISTEVGGEEDEETWLVFSKPVTNERDDTVRYVEIAFSIRASDKPEHHTIERLERSPLVVFFPTAIETHLGMLIQGPYRTTPSRDNIPRADPWNQHLVRLTASLLVDALAWLRDRELLDVTALQCVPLDSTKFGQASMFAPIFEATKEALLTRPLLPRFKKGYVAGQRGKIARSQELRQLFNSSQLAALLGEADKHSWLTSELTQDRTPDLYRYIIHELGLPEITVGVILPKLQREFLEAQTDDWILRLYVFLSGQPALIRPIRDLPLVRLRSGRHVMPIVEGRAQAFLPGPYKTGFPTVKLSVCGTEPARKFLVSLGMTEPDPIDDIVRNVLPTYQRDAVDVSEENYEADIKRMLRAFATDSVDQREKLLSALRTAKFVATADSESGERSFSTPGQAYVATERLKSLFSGVAGIRIVDDTYACLRGEAVREMLEAAGAVRYLRPIADYSLTWDERRDLRVEAGHEETSYQKDRIADWALVGLSDALTFLSKTDAEVRCAKAKFLWEELAHLEERRGKGVFTGEYSWSHYGTYRVEFDAAFVRVLNSVDWIPDASGTLQRPEFVLFDALDWEPSPFLLSKIRFKPPIIDQLAREVGIEPGVVELLKKLGLTNVAELRERLGVKEETTLDGEEVDNVDDAVKKLLGETQEPTPPMPDPTEPSGAEHASDSPGLQSGGTGQSGGGTGEGHGTGGGGVGTGQHQPKAGTKGTAGGSVRTFISYVAARVEDQEPDPDGLNQTARMALEAKAIDFILAREPEWKRTPTHNPGYDLYRAGEQGVPVQWCEVKAMSGTLRDRPVGLSRAQFECARDFGTAYWLYVVEQAAGNEARLVRIQDPAGRARTFTFDRGWLEVAVPDLKQ